MKQQSDAIHALEWSPTAGAASCVSALQHIGQHGEGEFESGLCSVSPSAVYSMSTAPSSGIKVQRHPQCLAKRAPLLHKKSSFYITLYYILHAFGHEHGPGTQCDPVTVTPEKERRACLYKIVLILCIDFVFKSTVLLMTVSHCAFI